MIDRWFDVTKKTKGIACLTNVKRLWTILCTKTLKAKVTRRNPLGFLTSGPGAGDPQKRQKSDPQNPLRRYINETRSRARFFVSVGDPPADPLRSQKTLGILTCDLRVLVFDTQDGAETHQNEKCTRFE